MNLMDRTTFQSTCGQFSLSPGERAGVRASLKTILRFMERRKAELEFDQFNRQRRRLEDAQADAQFAREVEDLAEKAKHLKRPKGKK